MCRGDSDADVVVHAVMDGILGAAGEGDVGRLFPDSDPAYAGADSLKLLEQVVERVRGKGWQVENVDATMIAQRPKLMPHIPQMIKNLEMILGEGRVNVKATTEEGLGFSGSGEGMAAHAVCLLSPAQ